MKKLYIFLIAFVLHQAVYAQNNADQRTVTTRIADLLAQLPAKDAKQLNVQMLEITALGADGYAALINKLQGPGKGNNAALEYAIGGYSAYAMQTGKETERSNSVKAYCNALTTLTDKQSKEFIISQLEMIGKEDAVACLQAYLNDEQLADPAARALVKINTESAKNALTQSLSTAKGAAQLSVINGIGAAGAKQAVPTLTQFASSTDVNLAQTALAALAQLADPASQPVFTKALEESNYQFNKLNALGSAIRYTENLLQNGQTEAAKLMATNLFEKAKGADQSHIRSAALKVLAATDKDRSNTLLMDALNDKDIAYRQAALNIAADNLTASNEADWIKKLKTGSAESKAQLVYLFADNNTKNALPSILKFTKDRNQDLRLAAIQAAAQIGQDQATEAIYKAMKKGDSTTIAAGANALLQIQSPGLNQQLASYLPKSSNEVKVALIQVLAARAANSQIEVLYTTLKSKDNAVRNAAFNALSDVAISKDVPQLFALLKQTNDQIETKHVQQALIAALRSEQKNTATQLVLAELSGASAEQKSAYYGILASIGGPEALASVSAASGSADESERKAAVAALASWSDMDALPVLLKVAKANANDTDTALQGYLRIVKASAALPEQKYLKLFEAMRIAQTTQQKMAVLRALDQAKTFNGLVLAGKYLDDPALKQAAAGTVRTIVLSDASYQGNLVRELITKTINTLSGGDSEYEKEALRKYLAEMPAGEGFKSIFNGTDLSGWKGLVANPIKRSQMDAKTLAAEQKKADAAMADSWKVEDGELRFQSHGENIATVKKYGDFEMLVDWKIINDGKQNGDAGIYLRGTPQVQIWDTARVKDGAQVGSGGLYNNQVNPSKPLKVADNKLDEWNTFHIKMVGDRVTVHLNGELVTDNVILENYWDRKLPIFAEEQIELQAHGSPVAYRNIYIKEIPRPEPFKLSAQEKKEGYKVLFDGTNMHEWIGNTIDYVIEDGNLAVRPKPGKGSGKNLFSKDEYSDFVFRFEFQLTPGANNGLAVRAPLEGDAAYSGMELQILDNESPIYKDLHIYQYHGSIYGTIPAKRGFLKPVGEWNYQEVYVKGPKIKVTLNGKVILDADITNARKNGAADGKPHPGLSRTSGHIGFLGHGSPVQFRNIRIKDLTKK